MDSAPSKVVNIIVDHLIDHLHDDEPSLRACSLVQKEWLPSCRYHLFFAILINPYNIAKFTSLLESTQSNIGFLVQHLTVTGFASYTLWHDGFPEDFTGDQISRVVKHLVNLTKLTLDNSSELEPDFWQPLTTVQQLELHHVSNSLKEAQDVMYSLKGLQRLSFEHLWFFEDTSDEDLQRTLPSGCVIQKVKLEGDAFVALTNWLLDHTPRPPVLSFDSRAYDTDTYGTRRTFLESFRETITSLLVHFKKDRDRESGNEDEGGEDEGDEDEGNTANESAEPQVTLEDDPQDLHDKQFIDVSPCIALERLTICDIPTTQEYARHTQQLLSQITSDQLQVLSLSFEVRDEGPGWVNWVDLQGIATILDDPQFARLQKVTVECQYRMYDAPNPEWVTERRVDLLVENAIKQAMANLDRKGILFFDHTEHPEGVSGFWECYCN